ncbi:MAG: cell division protein FtsA [Bacteroidetes bacterium]|nr:cell division protein FtsA [Bacteroidota bacterium]
MRNNENPTIVGLDIGTTKIVAIAGTKNKAGEIEIIGTGAVESAGVANGLVLNIDQCTKAIDNAIELCIQNNPRVEIKEVYIGIGGQHIRNCQTSGTRLRSQNNEEISKKDLELLICEQYKTRISHDEQIIDIIPQDYNVDDILGVASPVGMCGSKIDCNYNLITGKQNLLYNIERCITKSFLKAKKLVVQSLASASAVTNEDDIEAGVMVLDIGGGTTDLSVFRNGILRFNSVIPIGGTHITNAISDGLGVLRNQAEFLKIQHGTVTPDLYTELQTTTVQNLKGLPPKEVSLKALSAIIQTNIQEIMDYAMYNLKQKNLEKYLHGGIILTGGSAQIKGLAEFTEQITGLGVRIGHPDEHLEKNTPEAFSSPAYATAIGLLIEGYEHYQKTYTTLAPEGKVFRPVIEEPVLKIETNDNIELPILPITLPEGGTQTKKTNRGFMENLKYKFMGIFERVDDEALA